MSVDLLQNCSNGWRPLHVHTEIRIAHISVSSFFSSSSFDRLFGLVVKASASRAEDPGFESCLHQAFPGRVIPVT